MIQYDMLIGIDASRAYEPNKTGTENYSYQIIKNILALPQSRKHNFILYVRDGYQKTLIPRGKNVETVVIRWPRLWTQGGLALETWRRKLDVLFIPAHTLPILRRPGLKTLVTIHGLEYEWLPEYKNSLQRWYLPLSTIYASRFASRLISVSTFTKDQLVRKFNVLPDKIRVISEGVDKKYFEKKRTRSEISKLRQKFGIGGDFILFVGTIMPRKNLAFMIRVYSRLMKKFPDIDFVIAGSKGWLYEDVLEEIKVNKADKRVKMVGRVNDEELAILMNLAKVYIQPSITEGFGLPVLEAMASSTPVISSSGGALPETVDNAGLVISSFKEEKWIDEIDKLLRNKSLMDEFIKLGMRRASKLTWEKAAIETLDYIENIYNIGL